MDIEMQKEETKEEKPTRKGKRKLQQDELVAQVIKSKKLKSKGDVVDEHIPITDSVLVCCTRNNLNGRYYSPGNVSPTYLKECSGTNPFSLKFGVLYNQSLYCSQQCAHFVAGLDQEIKEAHELEETLAKRPPEGWELFAEDATWWKRYDSMGANINRYCAKCYWNAPKYLFVEKPRWQGITRSYTTHDFSCGVCMNQTIQWRKEFEVAEAKYGPPGGTLLEGWVRVDMGTYAKYSTSVSCHSYRKRCNAKGRSAKFLFKHVANTLANPGACAVCMEDDDKTFRLRKFEELKVLLAEKNVLKFLTSVLRDKIALATENNNNSEKTKMDCSHAVGEHGQSGAVGCPGPVGTFDMFQHFLTVCDWMIRDLEVLNNHSNVAEKTSAQKRTDANRGLLKLIWKEHLTLVEKQKLQQGNYLSDGIVFS